MFSPTYHEGTILTIFMSHWHRAIYFIVNLVVYSNDTWIGGIHILIVSFVPFTFQTRYGFTAGDSVTSTGTYGWLFWTVFQFISSRLRSPGSSVKRWPADLAVPNSSSA